MTPDQVVAVLLELADLRLQRDQALARAEQATANAENLAAQNAELHAEIARLNKPPRKATRK